MYNSQINSNISSDIIEKGDTVHTKYGVGCIIDIVKWGDSVSMYVDYYVETINGNYKLTKGDIEKKINLNK